MFALAVPGLAALLADELASVAGARVHDSGFDGRSDVVMFTAPATHLPASRLAEDVFVEVGRTLRADGDRAAWIANRLWRPQRAGAALAARDRLGRPLRARASFRVVTRVLQERSFLRTELRRELAGTVLRQQPRWRPADPSDLEVWVVEYQPGKIIAGLRVSDQRMRQHDGRAVQRPGALRPTVAAAMVRLAGTPGGVLLDPCCGSGTILSEAVRAGWQIRGADLDPEAVRVARRNATVALQVADARRLPIADGSVDACVSNLPFGRQYDVEGGMAQWLRAVLGELCRVTRTGGRVVLLAPRIPRDAVPRPLRETGRLPIRLLGTKPSIYAYDRVSGGRSRTLV